MSITKHTATALTVSRVVLSLALLFVPPFSVAFYGLYIAAGLSDMADGAVARKTHTVSEFGEKLDTAADALFVAVAAIKTVPCLSLPAWVLGWGILIALIKAIAVGIGLIRKREWPAVHSVPNKAAGLLLFLWPLTVAFIPLPYSVIPVGIVATGAAIAEVYDLMQ